MKYKKNLKKNMKTMKIILGVLGVLAVLAVVAIIGSYSYYNSQLQPNNSQATEKTLFVIEQGETTQQVSARLESAGYIKNDSMFNLYMRLNKQAGFKAGEYQISPAQSAQDIIALFQEGKEVSDKFTILPGKRLDQIKTTFIEAGFSQQEVDLAFAPQTHANHIISAYKPPEASLEGYLFPETFIISKNTTATKIVELSLNEMYKALNSTIRAGFAEEGLTVHEGVIMASIVEKEVSSETDKPIVAQVFIKRFNENIALGSDVTFFYADAVYGGGAYPDNPSPYNTRLYAGLPPGPISNMSLSTLEATSEPANTDYLFFVTGDDGTTHFSNTLEEHNTAARLYCIELCKL